MTIKTTTTIELAEVKALEFECAKCRSKTSIPVATFNQPPTRCAFCDSPQWLQPGSAEWDDIVHLGKILARCAKMDQKGFVLRLEVSGLSASSE